ncbi:eEF1A lysine and N-terminal methyltransferase homolog [Chironomus tepperi]|uniref:eEF1A lysine and N-terminal methyltransferase homolog n=1 Tax=Chironomus tepperi TaxID=113505 RepID=UPI00391F5FF5
MNLLPKTSEEFATKEYWNKFFQKRGKLAFDWYGEFPELCGVLSKYIKTKDKILNVGCGNSKLSVDMFNTGYTAITNIDISEVVIDQMKKTHRNIGEWIQMDATKMTFEDESHTVILDKGTLDAMMSEESESEMVLNYFKEVKRVLKNGGRFVIISLLQSHILETLLNFFPSNNFLFRIVRCLEAEQKTSESNEDKSSMPVFVIIATKFMKLPSPIYEISADGESMERMPESKALTDSVLNIQRTSMIRNGLVKRNAYEDEIKFDLFRPNEKIPRFTLYILDQKSSRNLKDYAAFIAPQGRETEWLFSTKQGRRKLLESAQHLRLAIVILHRNQTYTSLDDVKAEINEAVKSFAPKDIRDMSKIPFLSLGSDVGSREITYKGTSSFSGDFVVEDVQSDNKLYRRLIFLNNQSVIQSEALLKGKKKIDFSYLSCQHHMYMILGMLMAQNDLRNLVVGLGGGGLLMYIFQYFKELNVDVCEIDPEIVKVAKDYFGLVDDNDRLKVIVDDGLQVIKNLNDTKLNSVLFDVDSKDQSLGISCPPKEFLDKDILNAVSKSLSTGGIFILNFVCRDDSLRDGVLKELKEIFPYIISYKLEEDVNEIFYCFKEDVKDYNDKFTKAANKLNSLKKNTVDIYELLDGLKINS